MTLPPAKKRLFCFGFGYTAHALAAVVSPVGWEIIGTHRDSFYTTIPETTTHLLISIPPSDTGDSVLLHYKDALLKLPDLEWVGYLSTTGVYGNTEGAWVDESSPVCPPNLRLENRVLAEKQWLSCGDLPVHIFRLAGIYGKGRSALDNMQQGTARRIAKDGQYFSRIHVEDIAQILYASITHPNSGAIYNVADDFPCSQEEVVSFAAQLLQMEPPPLIPFHEAALSDMARSFYSSNRRVRNDKIKQELGVTLRFPSYKEGLTAILSR